MTFVVGLPMLVVKRQVEQLQLFCPLSVFANLKALTNSHPKYPLVLGYEVDLLKQEVSTMETQVFASFFLQQIPKIQKQVGV